MEKKPSKPLCRREQRAVLRNHVRVMSGNAYDYSRCTAVRMGYPRVLGTEMINEHMFVNLAVGLNYIRGDEYHTLNFWCRMNGNLTKLFSKQRDEQIEFLLINTDNGTQFYTALYRDDIKPERFKSITTRS